MTSKRVQVFQTESKVAYQHEKTAHFLVVDKLFTIICKSIFLIEKPLLIFIAPFAVIHVTNTSPAGAGVRETPHLEKQIAS